MPDWTIPLFEPDLTPADFEAVLGPLRDGWLTMGERTRAFETALAERIGARHAFAVSSGTAALHLAVLAAGLEAEDEVLVQSMTFVACANVVRAAGARPVFVDLQSEDDWTLSPSDLEAKITPRTRAAIVVHYAGFPCRMDEIRAIARRHNLLVIEDCAHALVSERGGTCCGCFGDFGCFSFFSNKNMTTGEGGMVVTPREDLAERLRLLRSHGMTTLTLDRHQGRAVSYDVLGFGLNYRIDEIRSALGLSQLQRLDRNLELRREVYRAYRNNLAGVPGLRLPFSERTGESVGYHIFPVLLPSAEQRLPLLHFLKERGIQTSIHYPPIHTFTAYREYLAGREAACPLTEAVAARELTLPFYPSMTEGQIETVCGAVREFVRQL